MKNNILIIAIVLVAGLIVSCGETPKTDQEVKTSQAEQLVGGLLGGSAGESLLNTRIKAIKTALDMYYTDNNEYPEMLDELVPEYIKTKTEILDTWDTPLELETDDEMNLVIVSAGPDKTFGNTDDIKRRI
jgi:ABC-type glycerol-3-phosphate transport system substrate-binding protein